MRGGLDVVALRRDAALVTGPRTVRGIVAEQTIVELLADGPLTANELSRRMHLRVLEAWAAAQDLEIAWFTELEPFGARLLAHRFGKEQGMVWLHGFELHRPLAGMERRGLVQRIQIPGERPMLWRLP